MRKKILSVIVAIGIAFGWTYSNAAEYLGDFCWEILEGGAASGVMKAGVSHIGGGHYTLNGKVTPYENFDSQEVINGNAEVSGSNVLMTLTTSYLTEDGLETGICKVVLDGTLNGSVECLDQNISGISKFNATIKKVTCP